MQGHPPPPHQEQEEGEIHKGSFSRTLLLPHSALLERHSPLLL